MPANTQYLAEIVIGLGLIAWIVYRQTTWRTVDPSRMWRMPLVLAIVGVVTLATGKGDVLTTLDIAVLAGELALSLGVGAIMGSIARFRSISHEAAAAYVQQNAGRRGSGAAPLYESRTGWLGAVLWVVLIAVRVGADVLAQHLGASSAVTSTGMIILVIAANRLARTAVFSGRLSRHHQAQVDAAR